MIQHNDNRIFVLFSDKPYQKQITITKIRPILIQLHAMAHNCAWTIYEQIVYNKQWKKSIYSTKICEYIFINISMCWVVNKLIVVK